VQNRVRRSHGGSFESDCSGAAADANAVVERYGFIVCSVSDVHALEQQANIMQRHRAVITYSSFDLADR